MSNKLMLAIATAVGIAAVATTAVAAPLAAGTKLTIVTPTDLDPLGGVVACTTGSCVGMFLAPGLFYWTPLTGGIDGGIIIGKGQKSGGQEISPLSQNDGEIVKVWNYGANWGTFFTAPSDAGNVFNDANCTGAGCGSNTTPRLTDLAIWDTAWNSTVIPMGSKLGCNPVATPKCTADQVAGIFVKTWTIDPAGTTPRKYRMTYNQVAPAGFPNFPYELILAGNVEGSVVNVPPKVTVTPSQITVASGATANFTIAIVDPDGAAPTCRVATAPANGVVTLTGCTGGSYKSDVGFVGTNSFTVVANDTKDDSLPVLVNVAVVAGATSTYTPTTPPTFTFTATTPPTFTFTATTPPTFTFTPTFTPTIPVGNTFTYTPTTPPTFTFTPTTAATFTYTATTPPTFTYTPTKAPTPTYTPGTPTSCTEMYPLKQVTIMGKRGNIKMVVTGNITNVNSNGKEIKICLSTNATYDVTTNTAGATVQCRVKTHSSKGKGKMKVNDHIKCSDKPVGNDKLHVKIKSGEYKKSN